MSSSSPDSSRIGSSCAEFDATAVEGVDSLEDSANEPAEAVKNDGTCEKTGLGANDPHAICGSTPVRGAGGRAEGNVDDDAAACCVDDAAASVISSDGLKGVGCREESSADSLTDRAGGASKSI